MNITSYELKAYDANSFYGKAQVWRKESKDHYIELLQSYKTDVCAIVDGEFQRFWPGYSATTMRHINAFRRNHGLSALSKSEWISIPVLRFDWVSFYLGKTA